MENDADKPVLLRSDHTKLCNSLIGNSLVHYSIHIVPKEGSTMCTCAVGIQLQVRISQTSLHGAILGSKNVRIVVNQLTILDALDHRQ